MTLPTGTFTFLFTDIEGSTKLWDSYPEAMRVALARHDALLRTAIERNDGVVFKTIGDAFCASFSTAESAVSAALMAQQLLQTEDWEAPLSIRARMAIHTGAAEQRDGDYFGPSLNRVARLMSTGHGGQVLLSGAAHELSVDHLPTASSLLDLGSHRLKDLGRPEQIFQLQHPDLPATFRPLRSLGNPDLPNNLPQQVTSFIGRERDCAEAARLLRTTRLLTLVASGGTGKTRLSLQVAADLLDEFEDGVWFVELAPLSEPELVAQTVAQVLNIAEAPGEKLLLTLARELRSKRMLIVLDNCEHLVEASAEFANALLKQTIEPKILASSRQGMNIGGEIIYPLRPLSLPNPSHKQTVESMSQFEAVRLFIDRACAVRPDYAITNENAPALAHLCHRLDGIPLAIELAAARVRVLSVEEIAKRLDNRFRLLTGGSRTALPRQQTLRALIDWSYDILTPQEQVLFARLSVFADGWTLKAAEAVCTGDEIDEFDVFDLLSMLSDKSLVVHDATESDSRFRLLETLREYGLEKLQEAGAAAEFAGRHAVYFASAVAETIEGAAEITGAPTEWLTSEAGNVRAALDWLWTADRNPEAILLTIDLVEFWTQQGWLREARTNLERGAAHIDSVESPVVRACLLKDAARVAYFLNELSRAEQLASRASAEAEQAGAREVHAAALNMLAIVAKASNDLDKAGTLFLQAIDLLRDLGLEHELGHYLMNLGLLESSRGMRDEAQIRFAEALQLYERHSNDRGIAHYWCYQSDLALRDRSWAQASTMATESVERFRKIGDRLGLAYALANLAEAASRLEIAGLAESSVREAIGICMEASHVDILPVLLTSLARAQLATDHPKRAAVSLAAITRMRTLLGAMASPQEVHETAELEAAVAAAVHEGLDAATKLVGAYASVEQLIGCVLSQDPHNDKA